jgi:amino acid adenylation domain-containing protein
MRTACYSCAVLGLAVDSICGCFEEVARAQPAAIAIRTPDRTIAYDELNRLANGLARLILSHNLPPEARVAFRVPRGIDEVVLPLAILKAGAAYVPLDDSCPPDRLRFMLDDSECPLVITRRADPSLPETPGRQHIVLDELTDGDLPPADGELPPVSADSLAYVVFTSGSTGQPKGVLVEHRGVVLLARSLADFYGPKSVSTQYRFFPITFDGSVWETFFALLNGLELFIDDHGPALLEPDEMLDLLDAHRVDCLLTTPSYLTRATPRPRPNLKTITVCGEACAMSLARAWAPHHRFVNAYGPTENSVAATIGDVDTDDERMSIGSPLPHVDVLLVDDGHVVGDGLVGEIHLAGPAVARGYQRQPELTQTAFRPDDRPGHEGDRIYKTGDLGRCRPDGRFEFLGRIDEQVKVRGFRIEPMEIEAHLRGLPPVSDAVVVAFGTQAESSLAAFVTTSAERELADDLRRKLRAQLPAHMVPRVIETVDRLPVLPNGKLDRSALRRRAEEVAVPDVPMDRTDRSAVVRSIWQQTLGRDLLRDEDDFFALGGQSVTANLIVSRVREELRIELTLRSLFDNPTLSAFCDVVEAAPAAALI